MVAVVTPNWPRLNNEPARAPGPTTPAKNSLSSYAARNSFDARLPTGAGWPVRPINGTVCVISEVAVRRVVLLLTDVEGSTALWQADPDAMNEAMRRHHEIVHAAVARHGGWRPVDQGEGDAVFAAF